MSIHEVNIFRLSSHLESIAPVKLQVVLGLGTGLFGAIYSGVFYFRNHPLPKGICTLLCTFMLCIVYLFTLRMYMYKALDMIIFLLAVHGRALRGITTAVDAEKSKKAGDPLSSGPGKSLKEKVPEKSRSGLFGVFNAKTLGISHIVFPRVSQEHIPYDKVFEELIFRLLVLGNLHILYKLPFGSPRILFLGILCSGLSFGIRYAEYKLTKGTPPGTITPEGNQVYMGFLYSLLVTELCV
ncbi:uncharacterized protein NEMAJ01_0781 [Nematocida major]|uniref:uncharacterized protein n=1 Tax=Nematocida major TaxID=1912982 RepID=UPI00200783B2|nr:uncharacterized protein NEMAJ01_0781 [Nematocida major]KAH9385885.1 hypothetical protein NEMAJ01_0781 [Nematocida major]